MCQPENDNQRQVLGISRFYAAPFHRQRCDLCACGLPLPLGAEAVRYICSKNARQIHVHAMLGSYRTYGRSRRNRFCIPDFVVEAIFQCRTYRVPYVEVHVIFSIQVELVCTTIRYVVDELVNAINYGAKRCSLLTGN